jgi:hypothetical protein
MSLFRLEVDLPEAASSDLYQQLASVLGHRHCKHVPDDAGPGLNQPGRTVFFLESTDAEASLQESFATLIHQDVSPDAKIILKQIPEEDEG